jgi:SET domain-containing protein
MLLVKTKLDHSSIHRFGLFADELIPAGTKIWQFMPGFDLEKTSADLAAYPEHTRVWFKHFGYLDGRLDIHILSTDDAKFINHSDDPNMGPDFAHDRHGLGIALRDIKPSEEITIDYRLIEENSWVSNDSK